MDAKIELDDGNLLLRLAIDAAREVANRLRHLRQFVKDGNGAQPLAVLHGWIAADGGARGDISGNSGLGRGNRTVPDGEMTGNTDLSGENYVVADGRRPPESHLRAEHRVLANAAPVSDLDEIVYLG